MNLLSQAFFTVVGKIYKTVTNISVSCWKIKILCEIKKKKKKECTYVYLFKIMSMFWSGGKKPCDSLGKNFRHILNPK